MTVQRLLVRYLESHRNSALTVESARSILNSSSFDGGMGYNFSHNAIQAALREGTRRAIFERSRAGHEYVYSLRHESVHNSYSAYDSAYDSRSGYPSLRQPTTGLHYRGELSFGIECEMDFLIQEQGHYETTENFDRDGGIVTQAVGGWTGHVDGTCGIEIISPVFRNLSEASRSFSRQWESWISRNGGTGKSYVPYFIGSNPNGNPSIGHHIHIGRPDRVKLTFDEKKCISDAVIAVYPVILSITANTENNRWDGDILSTREQNPDATYCRWVSILHESLAIGSTGTGSDAHYFEISDTHHGTVEFRAQDANVPQVDLTAVFLIKTIGERALRGEIASPELSYPFWATYRTERGKGASTGFNHKEKQEYLEKLIILTEDANLTGISQAIKEVLYVTFVQNKVPVQLYREYVNSVERRFNYFKKMSVETETYLGNFVGITSHDFTEWITAASRLTKLSDLRVIIPPEVSDFLPTGDITAFDREREEIRRRNREETENTERRLLAQSEFHRVPEYAQLMRYTLRTAWRLVSESVYRNAGLAEEMRRSPDHFWVQGSNSTSNGIAAVIVEAATTEVFNTWAVGRGSGARAN